MELEMLGESHVALKRHMRKLPMFYYNVSIFVHCSCKVFVYQYATWWRCRTCGFWESRIPKEKS
jgi:hypothetical protein